MRGLFLTLTYLAFFALGATAPFVFVLGYVWVDGANPQLLSYGSGLLPLINVSLFMGCAAVVSYVFGDKRAPPRFNLGTGLSIAFVSWFTFTTIALAEVPDPAWVKWNTSFKTVLFATFIPYAIRSRIQIEAFLQVFLFSTAIFFLPVGLKTLISGGGYGYALSLVEGNSGLSEGATLAGVSLMMIPIMLFLAEHSILITLKKWRKPGYLGLALVAVSAAIGTYERTALVGLAVVAVFSWLRSPRKILFGVLIVLVGCAIIFFAPDAWTARISTTENYRNDDSALGRILVWEWTLGYVANHPLGGGFNLFYIDHIAFPDGTEIVGKAFHSVYFEILGEQGVVGFALFGGMVIYAILSIQWILRKTRQVPQARWAHDLAGALRVSLLTILACGLFIGIAFQPFIYYLLAMTISLREFVRKTVVSPAVTKDTAHLRIALRDVHSNETISKPIGVVASREGRSIIPWRDRAKQSG
jgi:putative inorganic carbon (hco3(-)) transporter